MKLENSNIQDTSKCLPRVNTVLSEAIFRPMLFSTPMVQALLNGTKTKTRRAIKDVINIKEVPKYLEYKKDWGKYMVEYANGEYKLIRPNAKIGDIIWVRESFYAYGHFTKIIENGITKRVFQDLTIDNNLAYLYFDTPPEKICKIGQLGCHKRPSLFMPKKACRLWLKVTNVRVERLHDISEQDAINEGIGRWIDERMRSKPTKYELYYQDCNSEDAMSYTSCPIDSYQTLWQKINGKESWDLNPFVWVYDFEVIREPPFGFR